MKIQTFKNMRGLIHGTDSKRIGCDKEGTLRIGGAEISIPAEKTIMPLLFNGCSGEYSATFTTKNGKVYELDKVTVRGGRIAPPPPIKVELMELRYRLDEAEDAIEKLNSMFDTNSLNFLIK